MDFIQTLQTHVFGSGVESYFKVTLCFQYLRSYGHLKHKNLTFGHLTPFKNFVVHFMLFKILTRNKGSYECEVRPKCTQLDEFAKCQLRGLPQY